MSVICGIFYYNGKRVAPESSLTIMRQSGIYATDATGTWQKENVFLGCHAQQITPESMTEVNPYHDDTAGLTITADAIIDNRTELCDLLGIDYAHRVSVPDSVLILQAYQKWGEDCTQYLLGDFAFAIWDERRQELFCAVDHIGTRTFYYYQAAGLFAFSTLIKPLLALPGITKAYSESWIADFLAMPTVMHQLDPELTLYQNIYLLSAGHTLQIRADRTEKRLYWQVERQPELKLKSDGEYEEAFREVFGEAVRCRLRSIRPAGVMMSGGMDSASVACVAARELAQHGHRLRVFSAVPMNGYRNWLPEHLIADETPFIEAVRHHAGNIDVTYCRLDGKHSLSDTRRLLTIFEQPYKIIENLFWIDGIMAAAKAHHVGVVLTGGGGNSTISWGSPTPYLLSLFREGRLYNLLYEAWATARRCHHPKMAFFQLLLTIMPYEIQKIMHTAKDPDWHKVLQDLTPINPDFARRINVQERFRRFGFDPFFINRLDSFQIRKKQLGADVFSHMGVFQTKHSLAYKMAVRDPTVDKRVIEFCLSLPDSQYVRNGRDRFLLRRAMEGVLPDKVRKNGTVRGRQSADFAQRLQPCWPELTDEIRSIGRQQAEREYLDIAKIQSELTKFNSLNDDAADDANLIMLIRSLVFSRFIKQDAPRLG